MKNLNNSFPAILGIGTAVPKYPIDQNKLAAILSEALELTPDESRRLHKIFENSSIEKRHSVIKDYQIPRLHGDLYSQSFPQNIPGSHERNVIYKKEALGLATEAAQQALEEWGKSASSITHVISVSCTGLVAPGLEFLLINQLGLKRSCAKIGLNFMGCFGAFRGLSMARAYALENPNHRVLLVCTELCSLHMQCDKTIGTFVSNALFSDGAGALIVGAEPNGSERPLWEIASHHSYALENSLQEMSWEVGNHGFLMKLTEKVPKRIREKIKEFIDTLKGNSIPITECQWAVHPGGKAILEGIAHALDLDLYADLRASWEVLKNFGNMSSATFLFVLNQILKEPKSQPWSIGLGFGPGLTLEGVLLKNVF